MLDLLKKICNICYVLNRVRFSKKKKERKSEKNDIENSMIEPSFTVI